MASSFRRRRPLTGARIQTFEHACGAQGFTLTEPKTMARNDASDHAEPLKLHSRRELACDGRPAMTRKMLQLIAGAEQDTSDAGNGADGEHDELADLDQERKAAALARLQAEHPQLYGIVYLVDQRGLSLRSVGRHLHMSHPTVGKHRDTALATVRAWCVDREDAS